MKSMHDILQSIVGTRTIIRLPVATKWLTAHGQDWDSTPAVDILDTLEHELSEVAHERGCFMDPITVEDVACATFNKATD